MTEQELAIDHLVSQWREQESEAKLASETADATKQRIIEAMHKLGLKTHDGALGKVTLTKSTKTNIVVDRKEFDLTLKNKGIYDSFCTTKFDMAKVKEYVEREGDDLYGMVELEDTYTTRFTPSKEAV